MGVDVSEVLGPSQHRGVLRAGLHLWRRGEQLRADVGQGPATPSLRCAHRIRTGEVLLGPMTPPALRLSTFRRSSKHAASVQGKRGRSHPAALRARESVLSVPSRSALQAAKRGTLEAIKRLRASGAYAWVGRTSCQPLATPTADFPNQWHYNSINLPQAWDLTRGSEEVVVAVVGTGILPDHPAFTDHNCRRTPSSSPDATSSAMRKGPRR